MKILTVVGARPQFIKSAAVSNVLRTEHEEILIHTGQHYDENMSDIFFKELGIPKPKYNLCVGSGNHGNQTGQMLIKLEEIYINEKPDLVLVYGDTNSTLSGALCASKLLIPLAHVEAGLRSFNMRMPEEQNRILTDHISNFLFTPTDTGTENLSHEGITKNVFNVGDVMYDATLLFKDLALKKSKIVEELNLKNDNFILSTIHRAENTNDINRLKNVIEVLNECGKTVVFPIHPRTKKYLEQYGIQLNTNIQVLNGVGYLDMINLEMHAEKIVTDSGGIQKEAFLMKKPCITLRDETEWKETVEIGWNKIVGSSKSKILNAIHSFTPTNEYKDLFGDGKAAYKILNILNDNLPVS
ncbi:UDP-N-acetylglucosamine 2-epimerase (non-hydrolyzing) (plasmid) [Clostridiaceae bacterium 14S0207]|nr:UDP-N-acetylglucosamine 2-epimerase (non-hydrolyzing) [Clostridiaceae bacterium 14S0207]